MTCPNHPDRPVKARRVCDPCYQRARYHGTVIDLPRVTRPIADLLDDFQMLTGQGYTRAQIAERLGMKRKTLDTALRRAKAGAA